VVDRIGLLREAQVGRLAKAAGHERIPDPVHVPAVGVRPEPPERLDGGIRAFSATHVEVDALGTGSRIPEVSELRVLAEAPVPGICVQGSAACLLIPHTKRARVSAARASQPGAGTELKGDELIPNLAGDPDNRAVCVAHERDRASSGGRWRIVVGSQPDAEGHVER